MRVFKNKNYTLHWMYGESTIIIARTNRIATTQRTLWNSKAMPYFSETSISFFWVCGYNKLNKFNEWDLVFADEWFVKIKWTAATRPLLTYYAKVNGCILWIWPWQNERQWRINDFGSYMSENHNVISSVLCITNTLAPFRGKIDNDMVSALFWKWVSM